MNPLSWWLLGILIVVIVALIALIIFLVVRTYQRQPTTGKEDLKGKVAIVREALDPEGMVFYQGDLWNALSSSGRIESGEEVTITEVKGLRLLVTRKTKE